ncbi:MULTISPECIES: tyrosine-type recombinase/integrase [unclassified Gilliamella]|uniref:tyrosine-type recombinase/integrase n=1 Tax=unclassified Gilliamella TaxID=2685620 RepID=UPI00226AEF4B|nr:MULTISPECIES: tyrosine-type recombinase/integrase [unclassified Gilliamella]MCX8600781.1 tyrosine-type recombinase/integrase [Gilliamella sp. B3722]MCX8609094.1 tyrosine-type recombinase/integrase [Gilliamella sp. B3771]MCX8610001.1 tyrosine-type recombinase/integrase [Gilliamella sp. B3891]MCX8612739.1 tyrosine-type recombinase/integrase [Gilliamella sp. B3773]MCX8616614.1 tyrosine-type recombinase/integrase [Gilliamella sp. B3770]
MSEFLAALQGYSGNILTQYATMLLIYTFPRTIEHLSLKWSNINFEQKLATIDEEVVKKDRVHLIPLATQAI